MDNYAAVRLYNDIKEKKMFFFISSGWFRQCDVIPYSRDVDLGIWIKDNDVRLMPAMQMSGMPLKLLFGKVKNNFYLWECCTYYIIHSVNV